MFGLGMGEIVVILIVALLFLGPEKLPDAARQIGKAVREIRKHTDTLKETIDQDEELGGTIKELKSALRGDEPIVRPLPRSKPQGDEIAAPIAKGDLTPAEPPSLPAPPPIPPAPPPIPPPVKKDTKNG